MLQRVSLPLRLPSFYEVSFSQLQKRWNDDEGNDDGAGESTWLGYTIMTRLVVEVECVKNKSKRTTELLAIFSWLGIQKRSHIDGCLQGSHVFRRSQRGHRRCRVSGHLVE